MCALSFTPYCRGQVSVALGQPIYLRGSRPQRAAAARPPHCPPRRVLQELVPFDIIGELRRTRRLFASSTPKMRSPAANSASINPAASPQSIPLGVVRLLLVHLEQQRQLEFVLPSHRRRRWPTPMHHPRLLVVQSSSCTAGPRKAAAATHPKFLTVCKLAPPKSRPRRRCPPVLTEQTWAWAPRPGLWTAPR